MKGKKNSRCWTSILRTLTGADSGVLRVAHTLSIEEKSRDVPIGIDFGPVSRVGEYLTGEA